MSLGRRRFVASLTTSSAACLVGCGPTGGGPPPTSDAGTACPVPVVPDPPALAYPAPAYFDRLSADLDDATLGTPVVLVDLDRLEANVDAIVAGIGPHRFRVVEKSLPSLDLLRHVTERAGQAGSEHFLVLHLPLLGALVEAFPGADVIVGKTHLASAVRRFFLDLPDGADRAAIASRVVFLADGPARLDELVALAADLGVTLRLAVELDVGLRRTGLREPEGLGEMLATFQERADAISLAGLFGYDGHVAYTPRASAEGALAEWEAATARYQEFVDVLMRPAYAELVTADLVFHSGGTSTFSLYADPARPTPVNDVATGGGVLRPGEYPDYFLGDLSPAIFVAAPALRVYRAPEAPPELPFLTAAQNVAVFGGRVGVTVYGGGWASYFSYPALGPAPLASGGGGGCTWVPNQGLGTMAADVGIEDGDWIYFHPTGTDVLFQFERIHLVRGGRLLPETWAAYPRRY